MVAESLTVGRQCDAQRPLEKRGRPRKQPIDGRTKVGRRTSELTRLYAARLGEAARDPLVMMAIERAAQLVALAEGLRQRALRGDQAISPDDIVRTTRLAEQHVRRLHLDGHKAQPTTPTLSEYLAGGRGADLP